MLLFWFFPIANVLLLFTTIPLEDDGMGDSSPLEDDGMEDSFNIICLSPCVTVVPLNLIVMASLPSCSSSSASASETITRSCLG